MLDFYKVFFCIAAKKAAKVFENKTISPEKRHGINIKPLLVEFAKRRPASEEFLNRFSLDLLDDNEEKSRFEDTYSSCACRFDARFYFVLAYLSKNDKKSGICLLGFEIEKNKILVKQIQGIRLDSPEIPAPEQKEIEKALSFLRWEKFLIKACEIWAAKLGFKKVGILKAENNSYFYQPSSDGHLEDYEIARNSRLLMHYNVTAKRMGYKLKPVSKYFMKSIKNTPS